MATSARRKTTKNPPAPAPEPQAEPTAEATDAAASPDAPIDRFDLVLFGATGFTGGLVAEYLAGHPDREALRWALAGRSLERLAAVRDHLRTLQPGMPEIELIEADSADPASMEALAQRTQVVCTTVGPYALYGDALVAACVKAGTHYCDLTGESQWIRRMIDLHHDAAQATGARIVHCCGFDSIPSDLGTLVLQEAALEAYGRPATDVLFCLEDARGGFSGGTVASLLNVLETASTDRAVRRILVDPYSLNPEGDRTGADGRDGITLRYDRRAGGWVAPFIMAAINTRVVRRSHALLGWPWGRDFRYEETQWFPKGPAGALKATLLAGGFAAGFAALATGPLRRQIAKRLPAPGEGPSREQMARGRFRAVLHGTGERTDGTTFTCRAEVSLDRDPGYTGTAVMLAESALCLALDAEKLPRRAGNLTPASAMGNVLVERLRTAGMTLHAHAG